MDEDNTLVEKTLRQWKNRPVIALCVIVALLIVAIATLTNAFNTLFSVFETWKSQGTKMELGLDQAFSGAWGNEGCVGPTDSHYLEVELELDNGHVRGVVSSRRLADNLTWNYVSLEGERVGKTATLHAIHVSRGKVISFGKFDLELVEKPFENNLIWRTIDASPFGHNFPNRVVLFPSVFKKEKANKSQ